MKLSRLLILLVFVSQLWSCSEKDEAYQPFYNNEVEACGVSDPLNNLFWLKEIVDSENQNDIEYMGAIWLKQYQDLDFFVTDMSLGSGGLAYCTFNCSGEFNPIVDDDFYTSLCDCEIIYINRPWEE